MTEKKKKNTLDAGVGSFVAATVMIFIMMVLTYILTFIVPGGGIPFWKWVLSPILVLFGEDRASLIAIIALLLGLGGVFNCLDKYGVLKFLLDKITDKFGKNRKMLLAVIPLFFMILGSVAGTYEECVPLVPVVVALAIRLGWDPLTGLGMSILAAGCGFAAGICNPFTIGVAQGIVDLPMFSGMWLRVVDFGLIYGLLLFFLLFHVKKIERPMDDIITPPKDCKPSLVRNNYYLDSKWKKMIITFRDGVVSVLPGVFLILMANSIRFTLMEANILDILL